MFGGIAEATNTSLTVLAERTTPMRDVTIEELDKDILTAQTYLEAAHGEDERRVLSEKIAQLQEFRHVITSRQQG